MLKLAIGHKRIANERGTVGCDSDRPKGLEILRILSPVDCPNVELSTMPLNELVDKLLVDRLRFAPHADTISPAFQLFLQSSQAVAKHSRSR